MMRGGSGYALAVRDSDGRILIANEKQEAQKKWYHKIFVIRGMVSFVIMIVLGMRVMQKSADAYFGNQENIKKSTYVISMVIGLTLSIFLFILLPSIFSSMISDASNIGVLGSSLLEAVFRLAIFFAYLLLIALIKDIKRVYMYHGAEHKTINCYESGQQLTVKNVKSCSTKHRRCGTTFLFFVMIVSIILFSVVSYLLSLLKPYWYHIDNRFFKMLVRIVLLPLVAGLSYELLKLLARLDNPVVRVLEKPGLALQRLTTREPTDEMIEVAIASFNVAKSMDDNPNRPIATFGEFFVGDVKQSVIANFELNQIEMSDFDWIICNVLDIKRNAITPYTKLTKQEYDRVFEIINKRITGVPLDYILGKSNFYGLPITVNKKVLIPRMETERVVEKVLQIVKKSTKDTLRILDLCTGSGCIAKAIKFEAKDKVEVVASDLSLDALNVAKINLADTDVQLVQSDLFENIKGKKFDIIVSNPPYIKSKEIATLSKEVQLEPSIALDGGKDGLDFYRRIASSAKKFLTNSGKLVLEIGSGQKNEVCSILRVSGFDNIEVQKDYSNLDRVVIASISH